MSELPNLRTDSIKHDRVLEVDAWLRETLRLSYQEQPEAPIYRD
jgi:hypothetical protein